MDNVLEKLRRQLGQEGRETGNHIYFQCPICQDSHKDNLIYTKSNGLVYCFADSDHAAEVLKTLGHERKYVPMDRKPKYELKTKNIPGINHDFYRRQELYHENLLKTPKALKYIHTKRGITPKTVRYFGIGIDLENRAWVFPIYYGVTLIGFEFRDPSLSSGGGKKVWKEYIKDCKPSCLATLTIPDRSTKRLLVIEGFIDGYIYWQHLESKGMSSLYHIVTPSNGVQCIAENLHDIDIEKYISIHFFLDGDDAGKRELEKIRTGALFSYYEVSLPCECCKDFGEYYLKHILPEKNDSV